MVYAQPVKQLAPLYHVVDVVPRFLIDVTFPDVRLAEFVLWICSCMK
jgi:hypothetical protein